MGDNKRKSIIVGTFGPAFPGAEEVPEAYHGNRIWYSPERKFFLITDDNNKARKQSFDMKRFRSFVDCGVIVFTSSSVEAYMMQLLEQYEAEQEMAQEGWQEEDPFAEEAYPSAGYAGADAAASAYPGAGAGMPASMAGAGAMGAVDAYQAQDPYAAAPQGTQGRRRSNRQDDHMRNLTDAKAIAHKDPTRHLALFMGLTLTFTIIAVIVINFGEPIVQTVAPLLS